MSSNHRGDGSYFPVLVILQVSRATSQQLRRKMAQFSLCIGSASIVHYVMVHCRSMKDAAVPQQGPACWTHADAWPYLNCAYCAVKWP
jgi:hypothetical protein